MEVNELEDYWPEYWSTHDISEHELARIARAAKDGADADKIFKNTIWWTERNTIGVKIGEVIDLNTEFIKRNAHDIMAIHDLIVDEIMMGEGGDEFYEGNIRDILEELKLEEHDLENIESKGNGS